MWEPLITLEQINEGSLIRQVILDGNHQHDTNYKVSRIGEFYFFNELPRRRAAGYR